MAEPGDTLRLEDVAGPGDVAEPGDIAGPGDMTRLGDVAGLGDIGSMASGGGVLVYTDLFFFSLLAVGIQSGGITL